MRCYRRQWRCRGWQYRIPPLHIAATWEEGRPHPFFRSSCLTVWWTCTACQLHRNLSALSKKKERSLITKTLRPSTGWMKSLLKSMGRLLLASLRGGLGPSFRPLKQMQNLFSSVLLNIALFSKQKPQTVMCLFLWSSPLMKSFQLFYQ